MPYYPLRKKAVTIDQIVKLSYQIVKEEISSSNLKSFTALFKSAHLEKKASLLFNKVINQRPFKRKNTPIDKHTEYRLTLIEIIKRKLPLVITLIALPKKSPNLLKTLNRYKYFSIGELYILAKLELFAKELEKYYKPVRIKIVPEASLFHKLVEGYSYFDKKVINDEDVKFFYHYLKKTIPYYPHLEIFKDLKSAINEKIVSVEKKFYEEWETNKKPFLYLKNLNKNISNLSKEQRNIYNRLFQGTKIFILTTSLENVLNKKISLDQANYLYAYLITEYIKKIDRTERKIFKRRVLDMINIPRSFFYKKNYYRGIERDVRKLWRKAVEQYYEYECIQKAKYQANYRPSDPHLYFAITSGTRYCFDIGRPFPNHGINILYGNKMCTKTYNQIADYIDQFEEVYIDRLPIYLNYNPRISNIVAGIDGSLLFKDETVLDTRISNYLNKLGSKNNLIFTTNRSPKEIKTILKDVKVPFITFVENKLNNPLIGKLKSIKKYLKKGHTIIICDRENDLPLTKIHNSLIVAVRNKESPSTFLSKADITINNKSELATFLKYLSSLKVINKY